MNESETSQPITSEQVTTSAARASKLWRPYGSAWGFRPPFNGTSQTHE